MNQSLILTQGKPFAFTFQLFEDDGTTVIPLPSNCGFRMHIKTSYKSPTALISILSVGLTPYATKVGETYQIQVPGSVSSALTVPKAYAEWVTDIEIYNLTSGECVQDGGAYQVLFYPEATT